MIAAHLRRCTLLAALAALLCAPSAARAQAPAPLELDVILSMSGPGAFLGNAEAQTLGAVEQLANKQGGIAGRPVKFNISDDQSNPLLSVQLANALIAKRVAVILGSSLASVCKSVAPLVETSGPLNYCFSPAMHGAAGGYVFSSGTASGENRIVDVRFFRERGYTRIAMLSLTDASGQEADEQLAAALRLPENKDVQLLVNEHFNPGDVSVAAQMARIKAARPQALITAATGPAFGTILRGFYDSGMDIPISSTGGNIIYSQMAQYKAFAPKELYFAATRGIVSDPTLPKGAMRDAQTAYFSALEAAGIQPSNNTALAWDPAWILIGALRKLGPAATARDLQRYVQGLSGWTGISGTYDFRGNNQRGIGQNALLMYRWEPVDNRFIVASKAAGRK